MCDRSRCSRCLGRTDSSFQTLQLFDGLGACKVFGGRPMIVRVRGRRAENPPESFFLRSSKGLFLPCSSLQVQAPRRKNSENDAFLTTFGNALMENRQPPWHFWSKMQNLIFSTENPPTQPLRDAHPHPRPTHTAAVGALTWVAIFDRAPHTQRQQASHSTKVRPIQATLDRGRVSYAGSCAIASSLLCVRVVTSCVLVAARTL